MISHSAGRFLNLVHPTQRILSIAAVRRNQAADAIIGIGLSDPYLSFASPLVSFKSSSQFTAALPAIVKDEDIGGLLIGMPIVDIGIFDTTTSVEDQLDLMATVEQANTNQLPICKSSLSCDLPHIRKAVEENVLWDSLHLEEAIAKGKTNGQTIVGSLLCPSIHAGVSLQVWLDEHCKGWQNTFG